MSSENIINNEEGGSNHRANRTAAITGDLSHPILQLLGTGGTLSIGENGRNNTATTIESSSYTSRSQNAGIFLDSSQQQQALLLAALQQQQALQQQVSTNALDAVSMDRDANVQAQALLLHHEGQLRAIRLLLEQQQQQGNYQHQNPLLLASSNAVAAAEAAKNSVLEAMGTTSSAARSLATGQTDHSSEEDKDSGKGIKEASQGGKKTARGRNSRRKTCEDRGADERKLKRPEADSDEEEQNNEDEQEDEQDSDSEREADDDKLSDEEYFKDFGANDDNRAICETFPLKLYRMLHEVEKSGKGDVVSFLPHGKSFAVRKPRAFVEDIMPK